jgi:hypothetical protein
VVSGLGAFADTTDGVSSRLQQLKETANAAVDKPAERRDGSLREVAGGDDGRYGDVEQMLVGQCAG